MLTTLQVWDGLIEAVKGLKLFADVRRHPLNKIQDEEFFTSIPDLQLPACLIIYRGGNDENHVRTGSWSAVLVFADPAGEAYLQAGAALDALRDQMMGTEICDGEAWVKPGCRAAGVSSRPEYCIFEVTFETDQEGK